jgi:iron complex outermembrane receptor protein
MVLFCKISAQNKIVSVNLTNEKNEKIVNATTQILRAKDSIVLFSKVAAGETTFSLKKNTSYLLKITAVNNKPFLEVLKTGNNDTTINVVLQTKTKQLEEVVVESRKPFVKQDDDKTVVDAEQLATSSTNAFEVLEKTPGAIVDQDGNVYLNSATPATIYINGREIKLTAVELSNLLKNLPASSISKIELLRNPSAKYDAASSGGIVNIVLKKGVKLGLNGSIDVSHFQGRYATDAAGFNVNKSTDKLNTYFSYNFTKRINFDDLSSNRYTNAGALFSQHAYTKLDNINHYAGAGISYDANKKMNIAYDVRMSATENRSDVDNDILIETIGTRRKIGENISVVKNTGPSLYLGNSVTVKYKLDSIGSDWSNNVDYTYFRSNSAQQYRNLNILPAKNTLLGDGNILNTKNIISYRSDLIVKTKSKITIELGTKITLSLSKNNSAYFSDTSTGKYVDRLQTNKFKYTENIAATYFQIAKTFGGLTVKPGIRLEYTDIKGQQIIPSDTTFAIKRTDLFPYVFLKHKMGNLFGFVLTGNAIFRRSITRPFYESLNPYPRYADQYTYDVGNPGLQPQFTTNYEFNMTANEFPVFSIGLNDIKNIFTTLTYSRGDTLFRTYDNLGTNKEVYMRVVVGIPPGKKYFFYAGTQMNIINYKGQYDRVPFTFKRATFTVFMFQNYKPTPDLTLSLNGFMRINGIVNFFELKTFGGIVLSANKSILNKKMNVILTVNDLLRTNTNTFVVNQPNFVADGYRFSDTRRFGIALKYNFGLKPKPEKKQGFEIPQEVAQ